jgi:hypothetical protein
LFILNNCRPDILNVNNANFLKYTCSTETGNAALPRLFQMIHSKKPISNASLNSDVIKNSLLFRVRDVKSVLTSRYEDLFSIQVNLKGVQIYILYKFVLKIRHSRICCFNDIRMGVAWVGILPRQGTGGSVPVTG